MLVIPALDLRDGACVQLVGGRYDAERLRLDDPLAVARDFERQGFTHLHLVDLDAATGHGDNGALVRAILAATRLVVQVGGGVRDQVAISALLDAGARRVVVGTRAIEDPPWIAAMAARFDGRLIVAADVREREVVTGGWAHGSGMGPAACVEALAALPLAGVLVTAVHREGALAGTDRALVGEIIAALARSAPAAAPRLPLTVAGGIGDVAELRALAALGADAAVLGMALYLGRIDAHAVAEEFAPCP